MSIKHVLVSFVVTFVGVAIIARVAPLRSLAGL
jgi:hypothetical protein